LSKKNKIRNETSNTKSIQAIKITRCNHGFVLNAENNLDNKLLEKRMIVRKMLVFTHPAGGLVRE
jgi:hypothetical protein